MFKPVNTILFATDLSDNCRQAFVFAAALAIQFQATLILLHVIERSHDFVEGRLRRLLGDSQYQNMRKSQENDAKKVLIGKKSISKMIRETLTKICDQAGVGDGSGGYHSREIVISDGDVVDGIIEKVKEYNCDLIIMGTHSSFLSKGTIGSTIKSVMQQSKRPVMVVPPIEDK